MDAWEVKEQYFKAVMREDWETLVKEFKGNEVKFGFQWASNKDTAWHMGVYSGEEEPTKTFLARKLKAEEEYTTLPEVGWKNVVGNTPLHEAASFGNLAAVKLLVAFKKTDMLAKNKYGETPLYRAAKYGKLPVVEYFLDECEDLYTRSLQNWINLPGGDGTPIIHAAIRSENFEVVLKLLDFDKSLLEMEDASGQRALHALTQMPHVFKSGCSMSSLESIVYNLLPGKNIYDDIGNFECPDNNYSKSSSSKKDEDLEAERSHKRPGSNWCRYFRALECLFWRFIFRGWPECKKMYEKKQHHNLAFTIVRKLVEVEPSCFQFTKELAKKEYQDSMFLEDEPEGLVLSRIEQSKKSEDVEKEKDEEFAYIRDQETLLLQAVANGILEVVSEILEQQPAAVDYVTKTKMNIMHVIIAHRRLQIFEWFEKKKMLMSRLVQRTDFKGFSLLHHVGIIKFLPQATNGPALQLQEELNWFDRVAKVVPPHYAQRRNFQSKKPRDYFDEQHATMLGDAKDWLKKTSEACSAVAVLVATVVFAAVITVPGGLNGKTGTPVLLDKPVYMVFTIMDIIGLTTSLASVVLFLSILMSPFTMDDFKHTLPLKLSLGFQFLFISVASTMMAFAFAVVLIMKSTHVKWAMSILYMASFLPISVFMLIHVDLFGLVLKNIWSQRRIVLKFLPTGFVPSFLKLPRKIFIKKSASFMDFHSST